MKSTVIECPECAGHGGEGVYCEDCLSTGRITVYGPPAEAIDQLRAQLAAAVARAEVAEERAAELEAHLAAYQRRAELDAAGIGAVCETCGNELNMHGWCVMCTPDEAQP